MVNMKEYYCLLLNNCYDIESHWVSLKPFSVVPNIIEKDINDLSMIENEFMGLDNTIIINEDTYHVFGGFPVFGELREDGKIYDVITGKKIVEAKNSKEANDLSYRAKYKADTMMTEEMLTLIDEESKKRYTEYLNDLEAYSKRAFYGMATPEKYFIFRINNTSLNAHPIIAKQLNGQVIDVVTKAKICPISSMNIVTSNLSAKANSFHEISNEDAMIYQTELIDAGIETYIKNISDAKTNSVKNYHSFVVLNKDHIKTKKRTKQRLRK